MALPRAHGPSAGAAHPIAPRSRRPAAASPPRRHSYIDDIDPALIFWTLLTILAGRALNVFPLAALVNGQRATEKIEFNEQVRLRAAEPCGR